ncbi:MAG: FHA domain-containing protein [Leucobacter sp.]
MSDVETSAPPQVPQAPPSSPGYRASNPVSARLSQALAAARAWARPASTGTRLLAFSIDVIFVFVVAGIVWFTTWSALLAVVTGLEVVVILAFLDARAGLTLGNFAMRIRTVRDDSPYSPGIARGFVRSLVIGAGSLVALVGGFLVVATSAFDPMRMGRSWADRAGRTLVVRVPTRAEREAWEEGAEAWAANSRVAQPVRPAVPEPTPAPASQQYARPQVQPQSQAPAQHPQPMHVSVDAPVKAAPPVRQVVVGEQVLLTFDTGQRVQLPLPVSLNLGRRPEPSEADDQLCIVTDPDSSVSKTHLRLECRGESVWLTDLGSTNGSAMLDETGESSPLTAGARVRLEDGSRVKLGNRSFTVATVVGEMQI